MIGSSDAPRAARSRPEGDPPGVRGVRQVSRGGRFVGACGSRSCRAARVLGGGRRAKVGATEYMHARGGEELGQADLDQARHLQNATGSPRHLRGCSPEEAWTGRTPIPARERGAFQEALAAALERETLDFENRAQQPPDRRDRATIERAATSRVLCELDYLTIRRR